MIGQVAPSGQACTRRAGVRTSLRGGAQFAAQPCSGRPCPLGAGGRRSVGGGRVSQGGATTALHDAHASAASTSAAASQAASTSGQQQEEQQQQEAVASAAPQVQQQAAGPFASITRILLVGQPNMMFRSITSRRMPTGPISLLLFVFALLAAMVASVRSSLVKRSRMCGGCKGYGVCRCYLCQGSGRVDWRAKFGHFENCPLCMNKRFTVCTSCGGYYNKPIFLHLKRDNRAQSDVYAMSERV